MSGPDDLWWIAPVLALVGALLGGMLASWVASLLTERRAERALIRDARVALERWYATRVGPVSISYPGLSPEMLRATNEEAIQKFFQRHFDLTFEAKAALGAVRGLDGTIGEVLDEERWELPVERIGDLRNALSAAERRVWRIHRPAP